MQFAIFAVLVLPALVSLCWAQAPGDEETRCTVQHSSPPTYPDTERNLMDSYNYEDLVPGNGTGSIITTAVWNDYSFDGNDVDGIIAPTYWQQLAGGLCRFQARVCGWRQNRVVVAQDNWLFTQHIRQDFDSTTYDYDVTIHVYASYSGPNCRERNGCRQRFNLLHYFTNTPQLPSTEGTGYMNRENYQRFEQPTTLVTTSMNTYSFTLPPSSTGLYIAVQDIGSCLTLSRLRVYRNNCKSRQVGLVQYPSAPSPTQPANIFTNCVANADHVGSRIVTCTSVGTWGPENPVCQCRLGYEDRETECVACSAGEYRSSRDSVCQRCPDENTVMTELAAPECRCRTGYFRNNESDTDTRDFESPRDETPDFGCTKPPGPPEGVSLTPQRTGMTVSWSPPIDDGGRTDDYYYVEISDPDNLGSYTGGQYLSGTSRSRSFSGLGRCTQYCIRVTAHNGVSDQDPDRVNTRTVEVCEETRRDRPDKVTGVQGTQPYVVWSPTPCSDSYRITFSKSGGTIRRNVASEYYIVGSSDIPEGSGVLRVTVAAFNEAGFGAESDTLQLSSDGPINPTPTTTTTTTTETSVSTTTETSTRSTTRTVTSTPRPVTSTRTVTRPAVTSTSTVTSTPRPVTSTSISTSTRTITGPPVTSTTTFTTTRPGITRTRTITSTRAATTLTSTQTITSTRAAVTSTRTVTSTRPVVTSTRTVTTTRPAVTSIRTTTVTSTSAAITSTRTVTSDRTVTSTSTRPAITVTSTRVSTTTITSTTTRVTSTPCPPTPRPPTPTPGTVTEIEVLGCGTVSWKPPAGDEGLELGYAIRFFDGPTYETTSLTTGYRRIQRRFSDTGRQWARVDDIPTGTTVYADIRARNTLGGNGPYSQKFVVADLTICNMCSCRPCPDNCRDCDVCQAMSGGLVVYPTTLASVSGSVPATARCADNAHVSAGSSLSVSCDSDGTWSAENAVCECDEGYEVVKNENGGEMCQAKGISSSNTPFEFEVLYGAHISWETLRDGDNTTLIFFIGDMEIHRTTTDKDYFSLQINSYKWLVDVSDETKITVKLSGSARERRDTDTTIEFTKKDIKEKLQQGICARVEQGALSTDSESVIDGTSIAIAIVLTFAITAAAVAFLALALGLFLHKRLERKKEKKIAADVHWSSSSNNKDNI